ncbi:beta-lactamase/transpeptidase-like protein [Karstenula rhodostoma CBS 690.94]|uniref:Beta-lactamase/transpeptidase-like protein n=1 Tax=Karstenula rhodostoma CBS 690.94 TaxID=1392251 RepID=A0A9P4PSK0_9PLEO|nr:beta-lactamase/transpeptidase-like protein [Karstenula rhodostoma CBS 690.94]
MWARLTTQLPALLAFVIPLAQLPLSSAAPNCPLIGPEFPAPYNLESHPIWKAAIQNITNVFRYIDDTNLTGVDLFSYSLQIFSTNPGSPILWERHRTAKDLPANTTGVKKVDGNTVYRLGSVTKVFTVLTFLAEAGDVYWNAPITKFIPELAKYEGRSSQQDFDPVRETDWDDITIGALASQVSGLGRDCRPSSFWLCERLSGTNFEHRWQFFEGLDIMFPSYAPWQTPTYSNVAYQLLAYALERITGKNFTDSLNDRVIKPLGLNRTFYDTPPDEYGVIPGTVKDTYWSVSLGQAGPGGNMYASASDLSKLGRGILSSKLIKPALTRRWLNPVTFASDFLASVSSPWGVRRIQLDKINQPHRTLTVYTKAGTFKRYTAFLTLLKDYNLGFTIMMAGNPTLSNFYGADLLGQSLIPAYDAVARDEADRLFSGTYLQRDGVNDTGDSSISISTSTSKPGLGISRWVSNGTDMISMALLLQSGLALSQLKTPEARLYYTQLDSKTVRGTRQSFKAVFEDTGGPALGQQLWSTDCGAWVGVTGVTYGSMPLDEFIFERDVSGNVVSVENLALRAKYWKVSQEATGPSGGWAWEGGRWTVARR